MRGKQERRKQQPTKDTLSVALCKHLLATTHKFVKLHELLTNSSEKIGKLSMGAVGTHFITVEQVLEKSEDVENKMAPKAKKYICV